MKSDSCLESNCHDATDGQAESIRPPLDPGFDPPVLTEGRFRAMAERGETEPAVVAVEREQGRVSRFALDLPHPDSAEGAAAARYLERVVKFLLWSRGGWRVHFSGPAAYGRMLAETYAPGGARAFDVDFMSGVYETPFTVRCCGADEIPEETTGAVKLGGHLDGCRIGFDLGASDFKVAAVRDGEVVYSDEFPWNPREQEDPDWHFEQIMGGLRRAADCLPRVDAIGGSSAGVIVDNRIMVASLFRAVPRTRFSEAREIFLRLRKAWGVPLEVLNDGEVTALAGALSLEARGVLGIAMGSSEAVGYLDRAGEIRGWLDELAFAPVDLNPAAAVDEWSGDAGVGAMYFSQQAVGRLLDPAGIEAPADQPLPEKLKRAQGLADQGDERAARIYETIGVYLGYTLPWYARFYDYSHVLILGRVTSGEGGRVLLERARRVLAEADPDTAKQIQIHLPDEKSRRVGQAVAAASLPVLNPL